MILLGVLAGLLLGLALGGRLESLINVRLRYALLIFLALVIRFGTQLAIANGVAVADALRVPLYGAAFAILAVALWVNRRQPGLALVAAGIAMNGLAITLNGGFMPVHPTALQLAGMTAADLSPTFNVLLPADLGIDFLLRTGFLGDVVPLPVPNLTNVTSPGDVAITIGLGWFVFATLRHGEPRPEPAGISLWSGTAGGRVPSSGPIDRPVMLGDTRGARPEAAGGGAVATRDGAVAVAVDEAVPPSVVAPVPMGRRIREHPYVRLGRDARFVSFLLGQTISLFGDRLHQVALGVLVLNLTGSALATGLVFLAATLPNLLLGPIAGTFVDRWDLKRVLIGSDLIRAALVLAIPLAAATDIVLVYPLVFLITAVSLFFRPAKAATVPRLVHPDDLLAANSATWTTETMADILGFPIAGLIVGIVGADLALAFWLDSASYILSALFLAAVFIPPVARQASSRVAGAVRTFIGELRDGWHVLRRQPVLFQNTLVSAVAQLSIGTTIALTVVYARDALDGRFIPYPESYAAIETAIGVGNLVGGLAVGLIGARMGKGHMVIAGFLVMGLATIVLGLTGNVLIALVAAAVSGVANLIYVIPTQTLFAQLTPAGFMGRVVALRSTLVFGALTGSMAVSGVAAEFLPVGIVIAGAGVITVLAAIAGWLLPAVRDA